MTSNFQVDLVGMVDLLSRHLYSSPQVCLRELVQNGVDALTARRLANGPASEPPASDLPASDPHVRITPADVADDGRLTVSDNGIGLSDHDIVTVLSTIGGSSKRDELGFARQDFLGQFGIGLLSCFLVTDELELITRTVNSELTWCWRGRSDGTYSLDPADEPRAEAGTTVRLRPRVGHEDLVSHGRVREVVSQVARHLPDRIVLVGPDAGTSELAGQPFSWDDPATSGPQRRAAAIEQCRAELGFAPIDVIPLADPETGTRGYGFVLPTAAGRPTHRVHAHHMLVSGANDQVLPRWAFFVRAILDTTGLRLTASRESLHEDDDLAATRDRLGEQVQAWLVRTARVDPDRFRRFLESHALAACAMAVQDDTMLDLVAEFLPWETTRGHLTLAELTGEHDQVHYCDSVGDYRQIAVPAGAQGLVVVNAGHAYESAIVQRWRERHGLDLARLDPQDLLAHLDGPTPQDGTLFAGLVEVAAEVLAPTPVVPEARPLHPDRLHVLLLASEDVDATISEDAAHDTSGAWATLVAGLQQERADHPRLVFNTTNPTVRRLAAHPDRQLQRLAVEALYAHALSIGRHRLSAFDHSLVGRSLPNLLDHAMADQPRPPETP